MTFFQTISKGFLAGAISSMINLLIATFMIWYTEVSEIFGPYNTAPIFVGCFFGSILASLVYYVVQFIPKISYIVFLMIVLISLLISFHLPYRIAFSSSPRFIEVTFLIQLSLGLMHTIVAIMTTFILINTSPSKRLIAYNRDYFLSMTLHKLRK